MMHFIHFIWYENEVENGPWFLLRKVSRENVTPLGGDSRMKRTGMLLINFEKNP